MSEPVPDPRDDLALQEVWPLGVWLPIATAPKDGTNIDVWTAGAERITDAHWNVRKCGWLVWGVDGFEGLGWHRLRDLPTHWMRIPKAPPS